MFRITRAAVITICLSFVAGCSCSIQRAKERVLQEDLYSMRQAIDQYTQDKNDAPVSLEDLVRAGYLRNIPADPMTGSRLTWKVIQEDTTERIDDRSHPPKLLRITDVHSGSNQVSSEGTRYSDW